MDSILSGEPSLATMPEQSGSDSRTEPSNVEETRRGETPPEARTETKEEVDDEPVPDTLDGFRKALAAARGDKRKERKKWQEIEESRRELERQHLELKGQLTAYQQSAPKASTPIPPPSPDDALTEEVFYSQGPKAIKEFVNARLAAQEQKFETAIQEQRIRYFNQCCGAAKGRHQDFDDAYKAFERLASTNKDMIRRMNEASDPAEFIYENGRAFAEFDGVKSLDEYRAKIEAAALEKFKAQQSSELDTPARTPIPKTLADARGSGARLTSAWAGPRTMEQILK